MLRFSKIMSTEKDVLCEEIYNKYIVEVADFLKSCEFIAEILRGYLPEGCYTNFRDSLFHFYCMEKSDEESEIVKQIASIEEHSNRSMRDAEVALCMRLGAILKLMYKRHDNLQLYKSQIDEYISKLEDFTLRFRLGSMMIDDMSYMRPSKEEFFDHMNCVLEFLAQNAKFEFKETQIYIYDVKNRVKDVLKNVVLSDEEEAFFVFKQFSTYSDVSEIVYEALFDK